MLSLNDEIDAALKGDTILTGLLGDELIYEFFEAGDRDISYPRVIYEEISNVPDFTAEDTEAVSRITYRISACADSDLLGIINAIERVMISINFTRHSADNIRGLPLGITGKVLLFITRRELVITC